jgi:hypothetical protein
VPPRVGQELAFTLPVPENLVANDNTAALKAVVTKIEVKWEQGGTRALTIEAEHNDSLAALPTFFSRVVEEDGGFATDGAISTRDDT